MVTVNTPLPELIEKTTEEEPHIINMDDVKELQLMLAMVDIEEKIRKEKNGIRVLLLYIVYPLAMGSYFRKALENHPDVDLKVCGPYTGNWIPWSNSEHPNGMNLPQKYANPPDISLPFPPNVGTVSYEFVKTQLGDWIPDIVLTVDAGINWSHKPSDGIVATIATDPHVLSEITYPHSRKVSDKFFNMQLCYSEPKDIYLPYAYSQYDHYPFLAKIVEDNSNDDTKEYSYAYKYQPKDTDCVLIGMPYENRVRWVDALRKKGISVIFENGPVFDEARALYNRGRIGLNWSSMNDLNARAFEIPAMRLMPVMNAVPDLHRFDFYQDTLIFNDLNEAIERVVWAVEHPDNAKLLAESAYEHVQGETYDKRIEQVLHECGF